MTKNNSIVAIYKSHIEAETAVKELQQAAFDMKKNRWKNWPNASVGSGMMMGLLSRLVFVTLFMTALISQASVKH